MKILRTADVLYAHSDIEGQLYFNGGAAGFFNHHLKYQSYSVKNYEYIRIINKDIYYGVEDEDTGDTAFFDQSGEDLSLPSLFLNGLKDSINGVNSNGIFTANLYDFPNEDENSLVRFDITNQTYSYREEMMMYHFLTDDYVYGVDEGLEGFVKLDQQLEPVWQFIPNHSFMADGPSEARTPAIWQDKVIVFMGPEESQMIFPNGMPSVEAKGGWMYCLNDSDGQEQWQLEFENAVDSFYIANNKVYVAELQVIHIIDAATGQIEKSIDTGLSEPIDRNFGVTVFVDASHIYFTHASERTLLIYQTSDHSLAHCVKLPEGFEIRGLQLDCLNSDKYYFSLVNTNQYVAQFPALEVDPANLTSEVAFELEPEMTIELKAAKDGQGRELVIAIDASDIDDALRFGEIYTRDEAQRHSYNYAGMTFADRTPTEDFNGDIRFVCRNITDDVEEVKAKLKIMEQRFEQWNDNEGFYANSNKNKETRLIAEIES